MNVHVIYYPLRRFRRCYFCNRRIWKKSRPKPICSSCHGWVIATTRPVQPVETKLRCRNCGSSNINPYNENRAAECLDCGGFTILSSRRRQVTDAVSRLDVGEWEEEERGSSENR